MNTIKKSYFLNLYNKGLKIEDIALEITVSTGIKATISDVRKMAKTFNVNLRNKPKPPKFELIDDTINNEDVVVDFDEDYKNDVKSSAVL